MTVRLTEAFAWGVFDDDEFLQHNAFRSSGAPTLDELREAPKKVGYLKAIYSNMHRGIVAQAVSLDEPNIHLLDGVTFAFLCMDAGDPATRGKVSHSAPCPCGSSREYKPCYGRV